MASANGKANTNDTPTDEYDVLPDGFQHALKPPTQPVVRPPLSRREAALQRHGPGGRIEPRPVIEEAHNPLSGLMRGLAVLSILIMLAGQGMIGWAAWISPDAVEARHAIRLQGSKRPDSQTTYAYVTEHHERELRETDENRALGLKLYGGGFLAAIAFAVLVNFTLPASPNGRMRSGSKLSWTAVALASIPLLVAVMPWTRDSRSDVFVGTADPTDDAGDLERQLEADVASIQRQLEAARASEDPDADAIRQAWADFARRFDAADTAARISASKQHDILNERLSASAFEDWVAASEKRGTSKAALAGLETRGKVVTMQMTYGDLIGGTINEYNAVTALTKPCVLRIEREDLLRVGGTWRTVRISVIDCGEKLYEYTNSLGALVRTEYRTVYEYTDLEPLRAGELAQAESAAAEALAAVRRARDRFFGQ